MFGKGLEKKTKMNTTNVSEAVKVLLELSHETLKYVYIK